MTSRKDVYAAIDTERAYQTRVWGGGNPNGHYYTEGVIDNPLTVGEFLLLIEEYASRARNAWASERKPEKQTLEIIRKIAGITVNCMEQHGAPKRE